MTAFDETLADALTTVRLLSRWRLPARDWPEVEAALVRLSHAAQDGDARGLARALRDIEDRGPTRLARISSAPSADPTVSDGRAPPRIILDLVNTLIHPAEGQDPASGASRATQDGRPAP